MRAHVLGFVVAALAAPVVVHAQGLQPWVLQNRAYFNPLAADPRAAEVSALAIGFGDASPFAVKTGRRMQWDISLGKEIPVFGLEQRGCGGAVRELGAGCWGIGLWLPVSFHMAMDFKDESSPVMNTDYRFGAMVKVQRGLSAATRVGVRLHAGHESTHLGDEYVIHAQQKYGAAFERVNVSYEAADLGVSLETASRSREHRFALRAGWQQLVNGKAGYYSPKLLGSDTATLTKSERNHEPYVGFEWRQDEGEESPLRLHVGNWWVYASQDVRWKTVYDFHRTSSSDRSKASFNTILGLARPATFNQKGAAELFFRFYRGVNPNGQFRSQPTFTLIGVGVRVPV